MRLGAALAIGKSTRAEIRALPRDVAGTTQLKEVLTTDPAQAGRMNTDKEQL
jgi:hypothetical protein